MDRQDEVQSAEDLAEAVNSAADKAWIEPKVECLDLATADLGGSL